MFAPGVRLSVSGELLSELRLESLITCDGLWMGAQIVSEKDEVAPLVCFVLDSVQVMGSSVGWAFNEQMSTCDAFFASVLVAQRLERFDKPERLVKILHSDADVQNRLGGKSRYSGAADMLNVERSFPKCFAEPCSLL